MADELDPVLEERLRGALRAEADAVPFTLRADTVRKVGAERARARRAQRFTGFAAAAAVVALAVGSVAFTLALRAPGDAAASPSVPGSTPVPGLLSYANLRNQLAPNNAAEVIAAESGPSTAGQRVVGDLRASRTVLVAISCSGDPLTVQVRAGATVVNTSSPIACDTTLTGLEIDGTERGDGGGPGGTGTLVVTAGATTSWRLVAGLPGTASPTLDANGILPMSALNDALAINGATPLVGLASGDPFPSVTSDRNTMGPLPESDHVVVALSCTGGSVDVQVVAGGTTVSESSQACDTSMAVIWLNGTKTASGGEASIVVVPQAGVRWRLAAGVRAAASPDPSALPSWDDLHAFAGADTTIIAQGGTSSDSTASQYLGPLGTNLYLSFVVACVGSGQLAYADAGGAAPGVPFASLACDGSPNTIVLPRDTSASATEQLVVMADPGTRWIGIVTDLGPSPNGSLPSADELLATAGTGAVQLEAVGAIRSPGSGAATTMLTGAAKAPVEAFIGACRGGEPLTVSRTPGATPGGGVALGTIPCDGTIQTLTWTLTTDTQTLTQLAVTAPAGTIWSGIIADLSGTPATIRSLTFKPAGTLIGGVRGVIGPGEVNTITGTVPTGATIDVAYACVGVGNLLATVDGIKQSLPCAGSSVGVFVPSGAAKSTVTIETDAPLVLNVEARSVLPAQAGAQFVPPAATLAVSRAPVAGYAGCGLSYGLPGGTGASESCGPSWMPIPDARALHVSPGAALTFSLPSSWTMTGFDVAQVDHATIAPSGLAVTGEAVNASLQGGGPGIFWLYAGDWGVRVTVFAKDAHGTSFSVPYYFRVIVSP